MMNDELLNLLEVSAIVAKMTHGPVLDKNFTGTTLQSPQTRNARSQTCSTDRGLYIIFLAHNLLPDYISLL